MEIYSRIFRKGLTSMLCGAKLGLDWTGLDWHNCALFTILYDYRSVLYGISLSRGVRFCA